MLPSGKAIAAATWRRIGVSSSKFCLVKELQAARVKSILFIAGYLTCPQSIYSSRKLESSCKTLHSFPQSARSAKKRQGYPAMTDTRNRKRLIRHEDLTKLDVTDLIRLLCNFRKEEFSGERCLGIFEFSAWS
jgi:hypothetical protein